jgi:hypothetical protein
MLSCRLLQPAVHAFHAAGVGVHAAQVRLVQRLPAAGGHGTAEDVGDGLSLVVVGDDEEVPPLTVTSRGRLGGQVDAFLDQFAGDWAGQVEAPADGRSGYINGTVMLANGGERSTVPA